jgi:hypothetical protein
MRWLKTTDYYADLAHRERLRVPLETWRQDGKELY